MICLSVEQGICTSTACEQSGTVCFGAHGLPLLGRRLNDGMNLGGRKGKGESVG
jgi:hypothetical protein